MSTVDEHPSPRVKPELKLYRPALSQSEAMKQVLAEDMAGNPKWQLTVAARQWFTEAMQQLAVGEGRGR